MEFKVKKVLGIVSLACFTYNFACLPAEAG